MVKTREVVSWHQMEKDQNQNIQDWSVIAFENKTRHLHVRTTCWPEQCPMSYKEMIEYGKHFVRLWQLVTLRPKGITPFHLLMNFESQCNPFQTLVVHGLKKLELTIQPEYKIYQTLDAINIIPYLTFLQAREWGIFFKKNWTEVLCLIWWISAKLFQKWNKKMLTDKQVDRCQNWRQILIKNCHVSQVS